MRTHRLGSRALSGALVVLCAGIAALWADGCGVSGSAAEPGDCAIERPGGRAEIRLGSDDVDCAEARRIYAAYTAGAPPQPIGIPIGKPLDVEGWHCEPYSFTLYPRFLRCGRKSSHFEIVSLTPVVHTTRELSRSGESKASAFQTSTGTVACRMSTQQVLCEVFGQAWRLRSGRVPCATVKTRSVELRDNGARFVCIQNAVILPDGESGLPILTRGKSTARAGPFTCLMTNAGLECTGPNRHGFVLSFQRVRLF